MKQKLLEKNTLDWNKIYINHLQNKVFIFKDKKCEKIQKIITLEKFRKLMKKVPSINFLLITRI